MYKLYRFIAAEHSFRSCTAQMVKYGTHSILRAKLEQATASVLQVEFLDKTGLGVKWTSCLAKTKPNFWPQRERMRIHRYDVAPQILPGYCRTRSPPSKQGCHHVSSNGYRDANRHRSRPMPKKARIPEGTVCA